MGKQMKRLPKSKRKIPKSEKTRKVTGTGKVKRRRGDLRLINSRKTGFDVKQKKGGKWVRTGERHCKIHTVCDCVRRTDPVKMSRVMNR